MPMKLEHPAVRDAFAPPNEQVFDRVKTRTGTELTPATSTRSLFQSDEPKSWDAVLGDGGLEQSPEEAGSLVIVDLGVKAVNQVTLEGQRWIEQSARVLLVDSDPVTEHWIRELNGNVESLDWLKTPDKIFERVLDHARAGLAVCLAYRAQSELGAQVLGLAMQLKSAENVTALIVPGVSVLDCLFKDLQFNPQQNGCQIFAAEHFLENQPAFDPLTPLILFLGEGTKRARLLDFLRTALSFEQEVTAYEPACYAVLEPIIRRTQIGLIGDTELAGVSILFVLPRSDNG